MKTQTVINSPKPQAQEPETGGISMAPPQFKLSAGRIHAQDAAPASTVDATAGAKEERVSNFAKLTEDVLTAGAAKDLDQVLMLIESMKHDILEVSQFKTYFQGKAKKSFDQFLGEHFGKETAATLVSNMTVDPKTLSSSNTAKLVRESIAEKNATSAMALLITYANGADAAAAYAEAFAGADLKTDLLAIPGEHASLLAFVQNFFGERQNYERVLVQSEAEATQAREIIARIYEVYGVDVNSQKTLDIARAYYAAAPAELKQQLTTRAWRLRDLQDLEQALGKYGTVTGANRAQSTRSAGEQSIKTVGRINHHIEPTAADANQYQVSGAGGAFFPNKQAIGIFNGAESSYRSGRQEIVKEAGKPAKKVEVDDSMLMVISHELGHGFFEYAEEDFKQEMKYWGGTKKGLGTMEAKATWESGNPVTITKTRKPVEAPPTHYAATGYKEDLAESVALYFNDHVRMRQGNALYKGLATAYQYIDVIGAPCPERMAFIAKKIAAWKKPQPAAK